MTYQVIDAFAAGLDTRKSPLTSAPGTLSKLVNAAITPGGEIQKRRAFVKVATLSNATTFGLAATEGTLWVWGRNVEPAMPAMGVPDVGLICRSVPNTDPTLEQTDFDIYDGLVYITCRTGTGALDMTPTEAQNPHYYNSNLTEGSGKGYYIRTYQYKMYTVLGREVRFSALDNPVIWDDASYIDKVVVTKLENTNPIKCTVSTAEISQFVNGKAVLIAGVTMTGLTGVNGYNQISNVNAAAGTFELLGRNGTWAPDDQTDGKVSATPVIYLGGISNTNPARVGVAVADIGKFSEGQKVNVYLPTIQSGFSVATGIHVISDISTIDNTFALVGVNTSTAPAPQTADGWLNVTGDVLREGQGYINLATVDSDAESLQSVEAYYDKLAFFSTKAVQIWNIDNDAAQSAIDQVLRGAGTTAPRSPLMYGSGDVLYLDRSGIRSLKAKDSSNSAAVSDVGSPVDPTIQAYRKEHDPTWMAKAISLLEPDIGRFWMVFPDRILVLSYFPGPNVTAWSEYRLKELTDLGVTVKHAVTCGGRVFFRDSAGGIWVYGGTTGDVYDNCGVEVRLPYLDGKKPGHKKTFEAIDATVNGTTGTPAPTGAWRIAVSYDFTNPEAEETVATITVPTWNIGRNELQGYDSHFSLRFYNDDASPATISNVAIHYSIADSEKLIGIHDATFDDLLRIGSRLCADDRRELALTRDPDDVEALARDAWGSTVRKVAVDEVDPVLAFGAKLAGAGLALVWGFKTERARPAMRQVTAYIKRIMIPVLRDLGVRRAICLVHPDNKASQVWLRHLGFKHTATRRDIGTQGEEVHLFQRDEPDA